MSNTNDDNAIAKIIGLIFSLPVALLWRAYVLTALWAWFIGPMGAPDIGMAHAYGLTLVANTFHPNPDVETKDRELSELIGAIFFAPLIVLGMGWAAHAVMVSGAVN